MGGLSTNTARKARAKAPFCLGIASFGSLEALLSKLGLDSEVLELELILTQMPQKKKPMLRVGVHAHA